MRYWYWGMGSIGIQGKRDLRDTEGYRYHLSINRSTGTDYRLWIVLVLHPDFGASLLQDNWLTLEPSHLLEVHALHSALHRLHHSAHTRRDALLRGRCLHTRRDRVDSEMRTSILIENGRMIDIDQHLSILLKVYSRSVCSSIGQELILNWRRFWWKNGGMSGEHLFLKCFF